MSTISADILQRISQKIQDANLTESFSDKWEVIEVKDGVATVVWLTKVTFGEVVQFEHGVAGLVLDLLPHTVWVLILGDTSSVRQWHIVTNTGTMFSVGVGEQYLGRVVNAMGEAVDAKGLLTADTLYPVEKVAPGVITRKSVTVPLQTGIKAIDAMIPVGRGQRELIIGDRQTGKTAVAIDTIMAQKGQGVICIYVAIGQKESKVARLVQTLREQGAMDYTIVVSSPINAPAVMQYIAPYTGCALGEWFMDQGKDALIIYDDLTKHAAAYREMSLLLRRPPGREAYPGDVFYLHSRLLERACRLDEKYGWGSLTALPIIETQAGDVSAYIPTNVISITDGQIYLESDLFNAGIKPAINVWLSVSRVWWAAQAGIMKKISGKLKLELAAFRELETFAKFGSDLDASTQAKLNRWQRMVAMLKQSENSPIPYYKQSVLLYAGINGYLDELPLEKVAEFEKTAYEKMDTTYKNFADQIQKDKKLTDQIEDEMKKLIIEVRDEIAI